MVLYKSTGNSTLDDIALVSGAATPELVLEWGILFGLVIVFTSIRTYARTRISGLSGLRWDDYLVWIAVIFYTALTANVYIIGVMTEGIANDGLSDAQRAAVAGDPEGQEFRLRRLGSMAQVVKLFIYTLVLWTLKASLLYNFAIRLTGDVSGARVRTGLSVGLLLATFLGTLASVTTSCRPFERFWQVFPDPGVMCQSNISPLIIAVSLTCNIVSDLYLVSLPIPVLLRAPLRKTQKLSLISLFSCNILITGVAIVRAIYIIKDPWTAADGEWAIRETFVAVITTNIPPIAPLIRTWLSPCFGRMDSSSDQANSAQRQSKTPKRSVSKASLKAQAKTQHNEAMANRYLSGVDSQARLPTYDATNTHNSDNVASNGRITEDLELEEDKRDMWPDRHALTTQGQQAVIVQPMQRRDEDSLPQKMHEIV